MTHFTTTDGLNLHYTDEGSGPVVLCLAGLTRNSGDFGFVLPFLKAYRVIRMDYRGRGQSDHASDISTYTIVQEGADAIALLDYLGVKRATILGTSRGGLIAMMLAATHPERLNGLILNDIGPVIAPAGLDRIKDYIGLRPAFRSYDEAADGLLAQNTHRFPGVPRDRWRRHAQLIWAEKPGEPLALRYDAHLRDAVIAQADADLAADLWPLWDAAAKLPLTVLHGENSDLLNTDILARMQARAPDMRAVTVPDRGHVPFLDEAEALDAILTHLTEHS